MDTAAGPIALAKSTLRTMLSNCHAFQNWDGLSMSAALAADRIYYDALPPPLNNAAEYTRDELIALRPFALIYKTVERGITFRHASSGSRFGHLPSGRLVVELHRNVPIDEQHDPGAADRSFENMVGLLISSSNANQPGLVELSAYGTYLQLGTITDYGPERCDPDAVPSLGDFQSYALFIDWGVEQ
jgi:hypothetical protein